MRPFPFNNILKSVYRDRSFTVNFKKSAVFCCLTWGFCDINSIIAGNRMLLELNLFVMFSELIGNLSLLLKLLLFITIRIFLLLLLFILLLK